MRALGDIIFTWARRMDHSNAINNFIFVSTLPLLLLLSIPYLPYLFSVLSHRPIMAGCSYYSMHDILSIIHNKCIKMAEMTINVHASH